MGTKSKTFKTVYVVFSLFLIPIIFAFSMVVLGHSHLQDLFNHYVLNEDPVIVHDEYYQSDWSLLTFYSLEDEILGITDGDYSGYYKMHGSNLLYYAQNFKTGKIITNQTPLAGSDTLTLEEFRMICRMNNVAVSGEYKNGIYTDENAGYGEGIKRFWDGTSELDTALLYNGVYKYVDPSLADTYEIAYAFINPYYSYSESYTIGDYSVYSSRAFLGAVLGSIAITLLVLHVLCRSTREELSQKAAVFLSHIWLEFKLIIGFLVIFFFLFFAFDAVGGSVYLPQMLFLLAFTEAAWLFVYAMGIDIGVNKKLVYQKSMCYSIYSHSRRALVGDGTRPGTTARAYRKIKRGLRSIKRREQERILAMPYQKRLHFNLVKYLVGMSGILLLSLLLFFVVGLFFMIPLALLGMIGLSYWFYKRYAGFVEDTGKIASHIQSLRGGNLERKIVLAPDSKLLPVAQDLNNLQDGLHHEIETRMKSEKMKVELITNVSHDLKTPLTSMINYIDLLKEEELQPDFANDYVQVLEQKSKRLKLLIENIFDISKATSGNMPVHYERLDMVELINQTLAECEDAFSLSELNVKKNFGDEKFYVNADGKMLWRVTENIINNAVKYSLPGTRIYLELSKGNKYVCLTVKNIANYEMNFTSDAIVERFVRGDESRTSAGTGLGLSIVKSFVEAMGGTVHVGIDGDLFKISVCVLRYQDQNNG